MDGDGDIDVLSASINDNKIAWYENNGSESFASRTITSSTDVAYSVYAVDMDVDGDIDVLSASYGDDKIAWYENDGSQSFTSHIITSSADWTSDGSSSVYAVDLDGDGDIDVLSSSHIYNKIGWYENDGSQSFTSHIITYSPDGNNAGARYVYAVDLDGDGDMDVISRSAIGDDITWNENLRL
jgi:hypothetical protein